MERINGASQAVGNSARFGVGSDCFDIDSSGEVSLSGEAKGLLTLRPNIQFDEIRKVAKPDLETLGASTYYSLPIYNNDNEEIFGDLRAPYRWDGVTAPKVRVLACLTGTETVGHAISISIAYSSVATIGAISATTATLSSERRVVSGRNAQYSCYSFSFTLATDMSPRDNLSFLLRRSSATIATDISNELGALDWAVEWEADKLYGNEQ